MVSWKERPDKKDLPLSSAEIKNEWSYTSSLLPPSCPVQGKLYLLRLENNRHHETYTFITITVHLLLFFTMTNKCTIISQIITLLHVSTLSCHPQTACNQYLAKLHKYILCYDQQMHNYFTNYHTATCFDTIVSFSDSL